MDRAYGRKLVVWMALLAVACSPVLAGNVLEGVPSYIAGSLADTPEAPPGSVNGPFSAVTLGADAARPMLVNPISGVPEYVWWYGCSPTSGGMMVGFWDGLAGYGNLYDGDASVWGGSGASGTKSMVASTAHITAGSENSLSYGDWHNSSSYLTHEANPDCLGDFMHTVNGGSYSNWITSGLEAYCEWDGSAYGDPNHVVKDAYSATTDNIDVAYWQTPGDAYTYSDFKSEIDANRPVLLNVLAYLLSRDDWIGHSIVGYGYQDNMFQVKVPTGGSPVYLTVGGMAVMDTWSNGTGQSDRLDWNENVVYPTSDGNGVEWWPFVEFLGSSWTYRNDWMISDAVTLSIEAADVIPEPATLSLLGAGLIAVARRRRRKAA